MLLHREFPKQQSTNSSRARKIKKAFETEQINIQEQYRNIKADIFAVVSETTQEWKLRK